MIIYVSNIWSYVWHIYDLIKMDHICVTYMIIYVCRHMMHIYDPALKSYVVSPCDVSRDRWQCSLSDYNSIWQSPITITNPVVHLVVHDGKNSNTKNLIDINKWSSEIENTCSKYVLKTIGSTSCLCDSCVMIS